MLSNNNLLAFPANTRQSAPANTFTTPGTKGMPHIFRVTSLEYDREGRGIRYRAELYHDRASLTVEWTRSQPDMRIQICCLVSPRWNTQPTSQNGAVQINRLVLMEHPEPEENLFRMVPHNWVKDRAMLADAIDLIDKLPKVYRFLFNAIFWDGERFRRYCTCPSSMEAHHNYDSGNLMHSVELAQWMRNSTKDSDPSKYALAVLVGLLHDAGKADEYLLTTSGRWKMTDRGRLLGHKVTIIEWIAAAYNRYKVNNLPREHYLALLHCLSCHPYAPEWLGIRAPKMPEAALLSGLDHVSGQLELMQRCSKEYSGWGSFHEKLRGRQPYQPAPLSE